MRKRKTGQECPGCGRNLAVKNGLRGNRQHRRCRSQVRGKYLGCELQFTDGPEAYYHRFSAEVIARSVELYLVGMPDQAVMSYKRVAAEVRRQFSIPSDQLKEKTVFQWVKTYINVAVEAVRELTVDSLECLSVEFASLFPADGGCWVVQDPGTSYVLAAEVCDLFDPHTAREVIEKSGASSQPLLERVYFFTHGTE